MAAVDDGEVVRLVNVRGRRTNRIFIVLAVVIAAWALAAGIAGAIAGDVPWFVVPLLPAFTPATIILAAIVPARLLGVPQAQPWLDLSVRGLDYGGRQFVPWAKVVAIRDRVAPLGPWQFWIAVDGWEPQGRMARLISRRAVPLDTFDLDWRLKGVPEAVRRWAPHVTIVD